MKSNCRMEIADENDEKNFGQIDVGKTIWDDKNFLNFAFTLVSNEGEKRHYDLKVGPICYDHWGLRNLIKVEELTFDDSELCNGILGKKRKTKDDEYVVKNLKIENPRHYNTRNSGKK